VTHVVVMKVTTTVTSMTDVAMAVAFPCEDVWCYRARNNHTGSQWVRLNLKLELGTWNQRLRTEEQVHIS
jgi:hypothetical protein